MSVPSSTEFEAIVAVSVAFPRFVNVAEPLRSPLRVITGDAVELALLSNCAWIDDVTPST